MSAWSFFSGPEKTIVTIFRVSADRVSSDSGVERTSFAKWYYRDLSRDKPTMLSKNDHSIGFRFWSFPTRSMIKRPFVFLLFISRISNSLQSLSVNLSVGLCLSSIDVSFHFNVFRNLRLPSSNHPDQRFQNRFPTGWGLDQWHINGYNCLHYALNCIRSSTFEGAETGRITTSLTSFIAFQINIFWSEPS
jgi:hypothetical protein